MKFLAQFASNKLYLAAAAALLVLLLVGVVLIIWRHRRASRRSKYGFRAEPDATSQPAVLTDPALPDTRELDQFISKRGQRIADVLLDYASAKGLGVGVYSARLGPQAKVWWVGEKHPTSNKGIIAAVHAGRRPGKGFRSKVVVLKDAAESDALASALKRAAQPRDAPVMHDSWGRPISFDNFPIQPTGGTPVVDLAAVAERASTKAA